ncbi:MAG: DUF4369 domain-containing protein [Saprospiraceae bacterium]|nr:DUF4369 domain-containing protein [Saprospiraceae bacterium]
MNSFFRSLILIIFFAVSTQAQTKITIELKNYDNDTLILGNYFGEKTLVKDTILAKSKGRFVYQPKDTVALGVYLVLLKPSNDFFQYLVNGIDKEVTVYANAKVLDEVDVKGSPENKAFYDYMKFLKTIRPEADTLKAQLDRTKKAELPTTKEEKALEDLDKKVQKEQNDIIAKYPGSVLSLLLKANIEPVIPEF